MIDWFEVAALVGYAVVVSAGFIVALGAVAAGVTKVIRWALR